MINQFKKFILDRLGALDHQSLNVNHDIIRGKELAYGEMYKFIEEWYNNTDLATRYLQANSEKSTDLRIKNNTGYVLCYIPVTLPDGSLEISVLEKGK